MSIESKLMKYKKAITDAEKEKERVLGSLDPHINSLCDTLGIETDIDLKSLLKKAQEEINKLGKTSQKEQKRLSALMEEIETEVESWEDE